MALSRCTSFRVRLNLYLMPFNRFFLMKELQEIWQISNILNALDKKTTVNFFCKFFSFLCSWLPLAFYLFYLHRQTGLIIKKISSIYIKDEIKFFAFKLNKIQTFQSIITSKNFGFWHPCNAFQDYLKIIRAHMKITNCGNIRKSVLLSMIFYFCQ